MSGFSLKELKKVEAQLTRLSEYANNKKIGYEPKCKICNSEFQNRVEALREDGYTLEEIRDYLEDEGESISIMSVSRHFDRHYPTRKAYLLGLSEEKTRAITEGEKVIEEDLKYDPEFNEELESNHTYYDFDENHEYRSYTKKGRDIYIFDFGYCITGCRFCKLVPKLQRNIGMEVTDNLETDIFKINEGIINDWMDKKKNKLIEDSLKCIRCQAFHHECVTEGILKIILNRFYGTEMEPEEFRELLFSEDYVYEDFDKKITSKNSSENNKDT